MEQNNGIKTWQWVVTVIVIILLIILGYNMFKGSPSTQTSTSTKSTSSENTTTLNDVNRIAVADQAPGNIVYISSVQLSKAGYVAIHKDSNGTPGAIIGYKNFEKGIHPGQITLTSPTVNGNIYYAVLHSDDGDKVFDANKDLPIKDASGNIIMKPFNVTINPTELKG